MQTILKAPRPEPLPCFSTWVPSAPKNIKQYARAPILHKYFGEKNYIQIFVYKKTNLTSIWNHIKTA